MRAGKLIGVAAAVLGVAVVAAFLTMPRIQAVTQDKQAAPNIIIRQGATPAIDILGGGGPRLGGQIRELEKDELAELKLTSLNGVAVVEVNEDSAAERAVSGPGVGVHGVR